MIADYMRYRKARQRAEKLMEVDSKEILRDFVLDTRLLEAQQVSTLLGLPEITEGDIEASERRSKRVSHLLPLITFFSVHFSNGVMNYYNTVAGDDQTEEETLLMQAWVTKIVTSCSLGILAQLDALDLLEVKS